MNRGASISQSKNVCERRIRRAWLMAFAGLLCLSASAPAEDGHRAPSGRAPIRASFGRALQGLQRSSLIHPETWEVERRAVWPRLDLADIHAEDAFLDQAAGVPMRIGVNRLAPEGIISTRTHGTWTVAERGDRVWRMVLHARGAEAVRVHFAQFDLPRNSLLVVSDLRGEVVLNYGELGLNRLDEFWSAALPGPRVFLELHCPPGAPEPTLFIDRISHIYRQGRSDADLRDAFGNVLIPRLLGCQQDVNCHAVDENAKDAVGRMVFTKTDGETYLCSGVLLNDNDPGSSAGYFLTANHCINTQSQLDTLSVYWFYETDTCNGSAPSPISLPRSDGGTLLATSSQTDFTLCRLAEDPSDGQGLAAWTTLPPTPAVHSIHHPGGSSKRYSFGALTTQAPICGSLPTSRYIYNDWSVGITEDGSSGAPLFNTNWEVVGQLYGICFFEQPGCSNPEDFNTVYGRFANSYFGFGLSSYLNDITPDDSYEENDDINSAPFLTTGEHALHLVDLDDYFSLEVPITTSVSAIAGFDSSLINLDLRLLTTTGSVIDASLGFGDAESVSAVLSPGTYILHAYKDTGWSGSYSLRVDIGPLNAPADYDNDGDVDMNDYAVIQKCFSGFGLPVASPDCDDAPLDGDPDVDIFDMNLMLNCLSGANVPADSTCLQNP